MCPLLSHRGLPLQAFQGSHPRPRACLLVSRAYEALVADASLVQRGWLNGGLLQCAWRLRIQKRACRDTEQYMQVRKTDWPVSSRFSHAVADASLALERRILAFLT